jgi:hypothetical protein
MPILHIKDLFPELQGFITYSAGSISWAEYLVWTNLERDLHSSEWSEKL